MKQHSGANPGERLLVQTTFIACLLAFVSSGCVSNQHIGFTGTVATGNPPVTHGGPVHELCQGAGSTPVNSSTGVIGFSFVDAGGIVMVFDSATYRSNGYHLNNRLLKSVWHVDPLAVEKIDWKKFLVMTDAEREQVPGVQAVKGSVNIERWENNIDLKMSVAIETIEASPTKLDGVVEFTSREEWQPMEAIALILSQFGIGSE